MSKRSETWAMRGVPYALVNPTNMNAKQRREMRRWEKRYLPQMMERAKKMHKEVR